MLELEPVRFKVIRHVRPKLACASCDTIVQAPAPTRPIERGMAGPGLLAHVLVGKYADHLPLYRQAEIYDGGRVLEAACWVHVRRRFVDLDELHNSPVAAQMIERIGALYAIEQEIRGRPPHERCAVRRQRSRPLLDAMKAWLEQTLQTLSQQSATAKAIRYPLGRWEGLGRYCDDGRIGSTTMRRNARYDALHLGAKIICSPAVMQAVSGLRQFTACWAAPNSTATIPKRFSARCSRGSPNIQ